MARTLEREPDTTRLTLVLDRPWHVDEACLEVPRYAAARLPVA